jgi:4'-phosphopantetheinyl transferase EntD
MRLACAFDALHKIVGERTAGPADRTRARIGATSMRSAPPPSRAAKAQTFGVSYRPSCAGHSALKSSTQSQFRGNQAHLSHVLPDLFPSGVVAAEMREPGDAADLWPAEAECVRHSVPKRVMEFAAGRACARRALRELGIEDFALLAAEDRRPIWPDSIVGSITHTTGFCAAAVAPRRLLAGIGIDSEQVDKVGRDLWNTICRPEEASWRDALPCEQQRAAAALVFSAKEAFYKCQYPLSGEWLDFHDLHVEPMDWGAQCGQFTVQATRRISAEAQSHWPVVGRFLFHESYVTAAVVFESGHRQFSAVD